MTWAPDVTVAAIVERSGLFLMVEEQVSCRAVLNQPAGHLEDGEGLVEAVVRETREETGWVFEPLVMTGVYLWRNPDNGSTFLRVAFAGGCCDHDPDLPLDHGIIGTHWLSREQLLARQARLRSPMVLRCVDDYLAGRRFSLDSVTTLMPDIVADSAIRL